MNPGTSTYLIGCHMKMKKWERELFYINRMQTLFSHGSPRKSRITGIKPGLITGPS